MITFEDHIKTAFQYLQLKDLQTALQYFKLALALNPNEATLHNNMGNVYVALGNFDSALAHFNQALRLAPHYPETYNNLGRLYYQQKLFADAIPYFEKAIRMNKDYFEAHYNLAHSFSQQNRFFDAATHYREVLRLVPNHPTAHFNLGLLYLDNEQYQEAIIHLQEAFKLDPNNAEAIRQLGYIYVTLGEVKEAIIAYQKTLILLPNSSDVHHNLAVLYLRNEDKQNALQHFEAALSLDPKNSTARHMVTALKGNQKVPKAPTEYIAALFNQYADHYGPHVKKQLKYEVPGLLRNAIGTVLGEKLKTSRVLDLGCGTGLCGVYFRDLAFELTGVDLSENMLAKAKELDAYDTLIQKDIHDYLLEATSHAFDLIIAGDVFVYTGDLEPIFAAIARVLSTSGHFAFTIELSDKNETYYLQPTGRFSHTATYIQFLAQKYSFIINLQENIILREQEGQPVKGQLFVLGKGL